MVSTLYPLFVRLTCCPRGDSWPSVHVRREAQGPPNSGLCYNLIGLISTDSLNQPSAAEGKFPKVDTTRIAAREVSYLLQTTYFQKCVLFFESNHIYC